ncbi:major facilitator superfamily protein [Kipferlia bialata]|uniref:Major facilitator superfamily protein n=1 Tax=Kipferlia bialata TaxID=797122 RepID=A0A9K3CTZ8_9EUKA|nr:major facilitator superfamily protein [Kipferlia bialata]|eukprot:g2535.t1
MCVQNFVFSGPFFVGVPYRIKKEIGGDALDYGRLVSAYGLFSMVGGIWAMVSGEGVKDSRIIALVIGMTLSYCLGLIAFGLAPLVWEMILTSGIMGVIDGASMPLIMTFFQGHAPEGGMGTVMGALMMCWVGLEPLSYAATGFLFPLGASTVLVGAGAIMALVFMSSMFTGYVLGFARVPVKTGKKERGQTEADEGEGETETPAETQERDREAVTQEDMV